LDEAGGEVEQGGQFAASAGKQGAHGDRLWLGTGIGGGGGHAVNFA
jgi:hypothetical protein